MDVHAVATKIDLHVCTFGWGLVGVGVGVVGWQGVR